MVVSSRPMVIQENMLPLRSHHLLSSLILTAHMMCHLSSTTPISRRRIISPTTEKQRMVVSSRPMVIQGKMLTPRSNLLRLRLVIAEMTYFDHSYLRTFFLVPSYLHVYPFLLQNVCSVIKHVYHNNSRRRFSIMLRRAVSHKRSTAKWSTKPITSSDSLPLLVIRLTERGILADGSIVNPCRLQRIWYRPTESDQAREYWKPVATRE